MATHETMIEQAYEAFNKRNIDAVLSLMTEDVQWPKAWEGGFVQGYKAIRDYWTRQWSEVNPIVMPVSITTGADDKVDVEVHQVVKDLEDKLLFDDVVHHVYTFQDGKISKMEIVQS